MIEHSSQVPPVDDDFVVTVQRAVDERERAVGVTAHLVERRIDDVYLVGCGGSLDATYPVQYLLETAAGAFSTSHMTSNEFNYRRPRRLGEHSLVVVASHTGTTPETVAAIETARAAGAAVLGVTRSPQSELARGADEVFTYGSEETVWEPKHVLLANIAHGLLRATGAEVDAGAVDAAYDALPEAARQGLDEQDDRSAEIALALQEEPIIYVLGSGPVEGVARCMSMCYLQEMQWMHSAAFNAGEFFHGAFEVTTDEVPYILFLGEDATRAMGERAQRFLERYTKKLHVIDSRNLSLGGVPPALRGEVAPIALGAITSRLAKHFAVVRDHDLDQRRYMTKVEY